jgi:putative transposase
MARHPRAIFPGVALHVVQRGNNRNDCFKGDSDYLTYLAYLRHGSTKYECEVHAYCLMTNHVHLLLTPSQSDACSLLMRDLGRGYVRYFNRRHGRSGTLWEGRFHACVVESPEYVLGCYRYVELNPARAGMVNHPSAYLWSSYAASSGMRADPMLKPHCEYLALAEQADARHAAYRGLFEKAFDERLLRSIREATNSGCALVSDSFKSRFGVRTERGKPGPRVEAPEPLYEFEAA